MTHPDHTETADHAVIYLQPSCCADTDTERTGRQWCEDNVFECDDGAKATKYIRADSHTALQAENKVLREALKKVSDMPREYETEYDGRTYDCCTACSVMLSENVPHKKDCAWAAIDVLRLTEGGEK